MAENIITRKEALKQGLKNYYTGKPCKRGHLSKRNTKNCGCVSCDISRQRRPEDLKRYREQQREQNPELILFNAAKARARKHGRSFNLEKSDIKIPKNCPCCYKKFVIGRTKKQSP